MSPEQPMTPNIDQPAKDVGTIFHSDDELRLHQGSTVMSYAELKAQDARAEIAALTADVSPVATEALKSHIEASKVAPQELIRKAGRSVLDLRNGYDVQYLNILEDDELDPTMFNTPKPDATNVTQNDVDLAA